MTQNIPEMLKRLDDMYDREEYLTSQLDKLLKELRQIKEDKDLLQTMIMHQSNKKTRFGK